MMAWLPIVSLFWIFHKGMLASIEDLARLHTDLFRDYNKELRPVKNQDEPIVLTMNLAVSVVHALDMRTEVLTTSGWADIWWNDEILQWNASVYGGIKMIKVPAKKVWRPDVILYNVAEGRREFVATEHFLVRIQSDGILRWAPDFIISTSCDVDITYFPFDTQMCEIQYTSWTYMPEDVILNSSAPRPKLHRLTGNGEYDVTASHVRRFAQWKPENIAFGLLLKRKVTFYVMALILPLVLLSSLCVIGFLIPVQSGERMTVGITTLLSFTVYIGVIDGSMPKTSDHISILVLCVNTLLAISLLSVLGNAAILFLHHKASQSCDHQPGQSPQQDPNRDDTRATTSAGDHQGISCTEEAKSERLVILASRTRQSNNLVNETGKTDDTKMATTATVYRTVTRVNNVMAVIIASCLAILLITVFGICMISNKHINPDHLAKL